MRAIQVRFQPRERLTSVLQRLVAVAVMTASLSGCFDPKTSSFYDPLTGEPLEFVIDGDIAYVHVGPGVSFVCFIGGPETVLDLVPASAQQAAWTTQWSGPGTVGTTQRSGTVELDDTFTDRQQINQFGTYTVNVSVTADGVTETFQGSVNVGSTQGTCPAP